MAERVAGLAFGDRAEQRGDVRVALDVGLLREVEVPAVRLALARERLLEVVLGLASLEVGHGRSLCGSGWWWTGYFWVGCGAHSSQTPRKITSTASARNSRRYRAGSCGTSVEGDVAHEAARRAHEVLVLGLDVRVDPHAAGAEVEQA